MKITNSNKQVPPNAMQNAETAKTSKAGSPESLLDTRGPRKAGKPAVGDSARVDLSPRAQDIMKAKELATPSSDIDEAKVARLQKLIDEGKYKVDAEAIADRLLNEQMKMPT